MNRRQYDESQHEFECRQCNDTGEIVDRGDDGERRHECECIGRRRAEVVAQQIMEDMKPLLDASERSGAMKLGTAIIKYIESECDHRDVRQASAMLDVAKAIVRLTGAI